MDPGGATTVWALDGEEGIITKLDSSFEEFASNLHGRWYEHAARDGEDPTEADEPSDLRELRIAAGDPEWPY